jgi:hypothetical protein
MVDQWFIYLSFPNKIGIHPVFLSSLYRGEALEAGVDITNVSGNGDGLDKDANITRKFGPKDIWIFLFCILHCYILPRQDR